MTKHNTATEQDAYSSDPIDYYITYWCELPELPQ